MCFYLKSPAMKWRQLWLALFQWKSELSEFRTWRASVGSPLKVSCDFAPGGGVAGLWTSRKKMCDVAFCVTARSNINVTRRIRSTQTLKNENKYFLIRCHCFYGGNLNIEKVKYSDLLIISVSGIHAVPTFVGLLILDLWLPSLRDQSKMECYNTHLEGQLSLFLCSILFYLSWITAQLASPSLRWQQ